MRTLWNNKVDVGTLIASSESSGFPASNVRHIHLTRAWHSVGISDEWIKIDAGVGNTATADSAVVAAHNLTSAAIIKIQANATDEWTDPSLNLTLTWSEAIIILFFTSASYRFWRFSFADASNPEGYISIGRLALGVYLQMPPVEPGVEIPTLTTTAVRISDTGQGFSDLGIIMQAPSFSFPVITQTEHTAIEAMWRAVHKATPVFLIVWEDSLDVQGPIYCRINQDRLDWRKNAEAGMSWTLGIEFLEAF